MPRTSSNETENSNETFRIYSNKTKNSNGTHRIHSNGPIESIQMEPIKSIQMELIILGSFGVFLMIVRVLLIKSFQVN